MKTLIGMITILLIGAAMATAGEWQALFDGTAVPMIGNH